jgi:hypothetical protein
MINAPLKPGQLITGSFNDLNEHKRNLRRLELGEEIREKAHEISLLLIKKDRPTIRIEQVEQEIIMLQEVLRTLSAVPNWVNLPLPGYN